jgi:hypothetical protein
MDSIDILKNIGTLDLEYRVTSRGFEQCEHSMGKMKDIRQVSVYIKSLLD